jgi:hypothetical protein
MNKEIMTKALEEGGDFVSSESLASAFLMLGITDSPASAFFGIGDLEIEKKKKNI